MNMNNIASYIDHTLLKPDVVKSQIDQLCDEAQEYNFAAVCVPPIFVDRSVKNLLNTEVEIGTVIGFPFGYDHYSSKIETVKRAVDMGATECDVVVNISLVKSGDWDYITEEIDRVAMAIHRKHKVIMKLILETAYLNDDELVRLCNLCKEYNVDYAKTSTGYAPEGAVIDTVKRMKELCGDQVLIKASGGIRSREKALEMIEAGASRIGTSSGIKIITG